MNINKDQSTNQTSIIQTPCSLFVFFQLNFLRHSDRFNLHLLLFFFRRGILNNIHHKHYTTEQNNRNESTLLAHPINETVKDLALLSDEISILVNVWYSEQFGHQVVAEMPWRNLHSLTGFAELIYILNCIN